MPWVVCRPTLTGVRGERTTSGVLTTAQDQEQGKGREQGKQPQGKPLHGVRQKMKLSGRRRGSLCGWDWGGVSFPLQNTGDDHLGWMANSCPFCQLLSLKKKLIAPDSQSYLDMHHLFLAKVLLSLQLFWLLFLLAAQTGRWQESATDNRVPETAAEQVTWGVEWKTWVSYAFWALLGFWETCFAINGYCGLLSFIF